MKSKHYPSKKITLKKKILGRSRHDDKIGQELFIAIMVAIGIATIFFSYALQSSVNTAKRADEKAPSAVRTNFKIRLQGIQSKPTHTANMAQLQIKFLSADSPSMDFQSVTFAPDDAGVWTGEGIFRVVPGVKYLALVKGPMQLARKICDAKPGESSPGSYSCIDPAIVFSEAPAQGVDFSAVALLSGDLPVQDGVVDSRDLSTMRNNLGSTDSALLKKADVNYDGVVDTQDFALALVAMSKATKDDEVVFASQPTPTLTPTPTPVAVATPTSTPTPIPTDPPLKSEYQVNETAAMGGMSLTLTKADANIFVNPPTLTMSFTIKNNSSDPKSISNMKFLIKVLEDSFDPKSITPSSFTLVSGESKDFVVMHEFSGDLSKYISVRNVYVTAVDAAGIKGAKWRMPFGP